MSHDEGEDIADLLANIAAAGGGNLMLDDEDDMDDPDYEYYLDAEDIDDEMGLDEEYVDDDEDEDYFDEDDEDAPDVVFTADPTTGLVDVDEDDDDDEDMDEDDDDGVGQGTLQELAALFNNAPNAEARSSLLARLLAGPGVGPGRGTDAGPVTRSGQILRRLGMGHGMTDEERARAAADRRRRERWWKPQLEADPNGQELLQSGEFGRVKGWKAAGKRRRGATRCLVKDRHYSWTPTMAQVGTLPHPLEIERNRDWSVSDD